MKKRRLIDIGMVILMPMLMAYSMVGETAHEILGITMFVLFICHHIVNRKWFKSLGSGGWNAIRRLNTIIDLTMLILMVVMMVSAITISKHVFSFLNAGGAAIGRVLHLVGANWLFVLMSVHLGLHVNAMIGNMKLNRNMKLSRTLCAVFIVIALYGFYAMIKRGFLSYLFLAKMYASFDLSEPAVFFILDYFAIIVMFAVIGFYINRALIKNAGEHPAITYEAKSDDRGTDNGGEKIMKTGKRKIVIAIFGIIILAAGLIWGVPYIRRHFITVKMDSNAVKTDRTANLSGKTLIIQFTRVGNSDFDEDVDAVSSASLMLDEEGKLVGNAQLLAEEARDYSGGDLYAIRVKNLYPSSYSDTVSVAGKELRSEGFPELNTDIPLPDISKYDRVILVFPLWWGTVPKAVEGFLSMEDFSGRDVFLILTHGGGGASGVPEDLPPMIKNGRLDDNILLVYDDEVDESADKVFEWLKSLE